MSEFLVSLLLLAAVLGIGLILSIIMRRIEQRMKPPPDDRCPVDAMDRGMTPVEAAVWHVWGERCSDFEPTCITCQAWAEFDRIGPVGLSEEAFKNFMDVLNNPPPPRQKLKDLFAEYKTLLKDDRQEMASKWQPMDTAPKDGTEVLMVFVFEDGETLHRVVRWDGSAMWPWREEYTGYREGEAKGWMPLPPPPQEES